MYGANMPLNQVATVSAPEPRMLSVQVWDRSNLNAVEKAIRSAGLGINPITDGQMIRLPIPDLTEERRKELVKQTKKIVEESRVAVRMARRDANEEVKKFLKDKAVSEDEAKRSEADIQKMTDDYIKKVDAIADEKEKSIMTI